MFWTRSNDISNDAEGESEVLDKIREKFDPINMGRNDMLDGTIITDSYFRDAVVPVMTKSGMEALKSK